VKSSAKKVISHHPSNTSVLAHQRTQSRSLSPCQELNQINRKPINPRQAQFKSIDCCILIIHTKKKRSANTASKRVAMYINIIWIKNGVSLKNILVFQAALRNSLKSKFLKAMSLYLYTIRKRKEIVDQWLQVRLLYQ
jgi:hypothetical protein